MSLGISDVVQLKPHYSQHIADDRCVYLFSETCTYVLNGGVYCALVPLISSRGKTVEDIIIKTCDAISPEYILYAIDHLLKSGLITTDHADNDEENLFWWMKDIVPSVARDNITRCRVNVSSFGLPDGTAGALTEALGALGFEVGSNDPSALVILLANDYLNKDLANTINMLSSSQRDWLVIKPVGNEVWIGPSSANDDVCWNCVTWRLLENRLGQHALPDDVRYSSIPPVASLPVQTDCALNLVASYVARRIGQGKEIDIGECIHVLNMDTLETTRHYILGNPACSCDKRSSQDREQPRLDYDNSFTRRENGYRMASAAETYSRIRKLVSPISGLIPELCRSDQYDSSFIYYARHGFSISEELSANRIAGKPSWACGKGSTDIDARVSCVAEAIERYSSGYFGNETTIRARIDELENAISPGDILLFSENQYANRQTVNSSCNDFNWVPERFDPQVPIEWKECISLGDSTNAYIPARLCYLNYPDTDGRIFCKADANGCATGNTVEEALLFGLFELIERDAVAIWWFNKLMFPLVDLASLRDHSIDRVIESLKRESREVIVLDITTDLAVPTFACVSWHSATGKRVYIGYGTHLDPVMAMKRALNEVMQVASYLKENVIGNNPALKGWIDHASVLDLAFLTGNRQIVRPEGYYRNLTTGNLVSDISKCIDLLKARNLHSYFVDMTRSDSLLPTVRVIVPGLRHFWPRFAPGRLYDVPVESGLLSEKTPEHNLNKIFYPL